MEDEALGDIEIKTSRIYFLGNYVVAVLVAIFIILLYFIFNLKFTLFPKTQSEFTSTLVILGIATVGLGMVEQPEWARFRTKFLVTGNEVIKEEGLLSKQKVILPFGTVADISIKKSLFGRIFDYGTLNVSSFKTGSDMMMKGVRNPEKIYSIIQKRVNLLREGQLEMLEKQKEPKPLVKKEIVPKTEIAIENLEKKKQELSDLIEQTKKAFYNREIDEEQFKRTTEKYEQQLIEINVKLKQLNKK